MIHPVVCIPEESFDELRKIWTFWKAHTSLQPREKIEKVSHQDLVLMSIGGAALPRQYRLADHEEAECKVILSYFVREAQQSRVPGKKHDHILADAGAVERKAEGWNEPSSSDSTIPCCA